MNPLPQNPLPNRLLPHQDAVHLYPSGTAYAGALGRHYIKDGIQDRLARKLAVVDLDQDQPSAAAFLLAMVREMRLRFYQQNTIRNYRIAVAALLRWSKRPPHQLTREHVRQYLEFLIDAGQGNSTIAVHIAAIRTMFDKFCYRDLTLGLATPRRGKKLPTGMALPTDFRGVRRSVKVYGVAAIKKKTDKLRLTAGLQWNANSFVCKLPPNATLLG